MPDNSTRKRLKQKAIERWENEGGKIETAPKNARKPNQASAHEIEANRASRSKKSPVNTAVSAKRKRKSR